MSSQHPLTDAIRRAAREGQLRFNAEGRLVPVDQLAAAEPDTDDQPERHAEGSGDGGKGNAYPEPRRHLESESFNDAIRRAARGY